jgi:putative tryptophan/tyrosine transport system substrate-binding protein
MDFLPTPGYRRHLHRPARRRRVRQVDKSQRMRRQPLPDEGAVRVDAAVGPAKLAKRRDLVDQHLDLFLLAGPQLVSVHEAIDDNVALHRRGVQHRDPLRGGFEPLPAHQGSRRPTVWAAGSPNSGREAPPSEHAVGLQQPVPYWAVGIEIAAAMQRRRATPYICGVSTGSNAPWMAIGLPTNLWRAEMRRREFIAGLGSTVAWPLAAPAQQLDRTRRIGVLVAGGVNDRGTQVNLAALREGLANLGWIEGRNLRIDLRFGADDPDYIRASAAELLGLGPEVMVTNSSTTRAVQRLTQTIPIVITQGGDPVANGLLRNIARPEGNITGFISSEPSMAGKSLELLKQAALRVTRVAIIFNPDLAPTAPGYLSSIEKAAPALRVQTSKISVHNAVDIVRAIDSFATEPNGGLLVLPPPPTTAVREAILQMAAQHLLPAIFIGGRDAATSGSLLTYGADLADQNRRAASYVDRILRGAKVNELPVQFPTKYNLVVNLKTAKAIGLTVPAEFMLRANEVIE